MSEQFPYLDDTAFPNLGNQDVWKIAIDFDYKRWRPMTQIKLMNVNACGDYENVAYYETEAARDEWFDEQAGHGETLFQEFRILPDNSVKLPIPFDTAAVYNYIMVTFPQATEDGRQIDYEISNGKRRWFYFIDDVEQVAGGVTRLKLSLDYWQTFIYDMQFSYVMLERGHYPVAMSNVDDYLTRPQDNADLLLAEDVSFGEANNVRSSEFHLFGDGEPWYLMATWYNPSMIDVAGQATPLPPNSGPSFSSTEERNGYNTVIGDYDWIAGEYDFSELQTNCTDVGYTVDKDTPTNVAVIGLPASDVFGEGATFLTDVIEKTPQFMQSILAAFIVPADLFSTGGTTTLAGHKVWIVERQNDIDLGQIKFTRDMFGYPSEYAELAKLYTFPYAYVSVSDNQGNGFDFKIEETKTVTATIQSSLAFPFLNVRLFLDGINGEGSDEYTWRRIDGTEITRHIPKSDAFDMASLSYDIPTYACYIQGSKDFEFKNWFNREKQRYDAMQAYKRNAESANTSYENAIDSAETSKQNSDASADTGYDNAIRSAQTAYDNAVRSADTSLTNANASATTGRQNSLDSNATSKTNADSSADTGYSNAVRSADTSLDNTNDSLATDKKNFDKGIELNQDMLKNNTTHMNWLSDLTLYETFHSQISNLLASADRSVAQHDSLTRKALDISTQISRAMQDQAEIKQGAETVLSLASSAAGVMPADQASFTKGLFDTSVNNGFNKTSVANVIDYVGGVATPLASMVSLLPTVISAGISMGIGDAATENAIQHNYANAALSIGAEWTTLASQNDLIRSHGNYERNSAKAKNKDSVNIMTAKTNSSLNVEKGSFKRNQVTSKGNAQRSRDTSVSNAAASRDTSKSNATRTKSTGDTNTNRSYTTETANAQRTHDTSVSNAAATLDATKQNAAGTRDTTKANNQRTYDVTTANAGYTREQTLWNDQSALQQAQSDVFYDYQAHNNDPIIKCGNYAGDATNDTYEMRGWQLRVRTQQPGAIRQAGDYFCRWGYALNQQVHVTTFNLMKHFTYWKCSDIWCIGSGSCIEGAQRIIKEILSTGTTVWRDDNEIGSVSIYGN